jgi:hypothetical protein
VGGLAAGVWAHERKGGRLEVRVKPFVRLSMKNRKVIAEEADRLGCFLDVPATASFTTPA